MSRRYLLLGLLLLLPGAWAQAQTNRYQQIAARGQAGAAPAALLESRATPSQLPASVAASANPIQQVGFYGGYGGYGNGGFGGYGYGGFGGVGYGGYGGYGGGGGCASCGGGTGFVGECCDSMPSCARGVWNSYCADKACWHHRLHGHGGGCGGCGGGCGGCCFLPARGAPAFAGCGTFCHHGRFRGAYISDGGCGCGASGGSDCGCTAGASSPGLAPLPSPVPTPEAAASRGTFGNWAASKIGAPTAAPRVGFTR